MADMRSQPEETLIKLLDDVNKYKSDYIGNKKYLIPAFDAIYSDIKHLYDISRNNPNRLYASIANQVGKTVPINYTQSIWNKENSMFETKQLTVEETKRLGYDVSKGFIKRSKYENYEFGLNFKDRKIDFNNKTVTIVTNDHVYMIPLDGGYLNITRTKPINGKKTIFETNSYSNNSKSDRETLFQIISSDQLFLGTIEEIFGPGYNYELLHTAFNIRPNKFARIFNLMGNMIMSNYLSRIDNGFLENDKSTYRTNQNLKLISGAIEAIVTDGDIKTEYSEYYDQAEGSLKVDRFNNAIEGREILTSALSTLKGEAIRSFITNAQGNNMSLSGLTSLISSDNFIF
jgi:hypothetical protein